MLCHYTYPFESEIQHVGCTKNYEYALCASAISTYKYVWCEHGYMLSSWCIHVLVLLWWSFSISMVPPFKVTHHCLICLCFTHSFFNPCTSVLLLLFLLTISFNSSMDLHFQPKSFITTLLPFSSPAKLRLLLILIL